MLKIKISVYMNSIKVFHQTSLQCMEIFRFFYILKQRNLEVNVSVCFEYWKRTWILCTIKKLVQSMTENQCFEISVAKKMFLQMITSLKQMILGHRKRNVWRLLLQPIPYALISFHTHWKHQKTYGLLVFSGGIERG